MKFLRNLDPFLRNLLILALVALVVVLLDLETALNTAGVLLRVAFFIAVAVVAYFFWRDFGRREISRRPTREQTVFYAAIALVVVDLGYWFVGSPTGRDALAAIAVAAVGAYSAVRTWRARRRYS